jgi:hypothetical protein
VRTEEFVECVRRNSANPYVSQITVFVEDQMPAFEAQARFPALAHPKVKLVRYGRRLTYADLFAYANRHIANTKVIVTNADIFFDETLEQLDSERIKGQMICLSRWDEGVDGEPIHYDRPDSQDAWIFEPPLPQFDCNFCLGKPGCDNRLAYEAELALVSPS